MKTLFTCFFLAAHLALAQDDFELLLASQASNGSTPPPPAGALTNMLSAYWRMDWTNAAGSDAWGTNKLTPFGGVVTKTGLLTNCIEVIAASTQKEKAQIGPDIATVNKSWAFAGWFNFYNNATAYFVGKYPSGTREWLLVRAATLSFYYATNGANYATLDTAVLPSSNVWHLITAMVDKTNRDMIVVIDLATWKTNQVASIQTTELSLPLEIGCVAGNGNNMLGKIDNCGMWTNRTLSMAEITNLYAAGVGTNLVQNFRPSKFNGPMWTGGKPQRTYYANNAPVP